MKNPMATTPYYKRFLFWQTSDNEQNQDPSKTSLYHGPSNRITFYVGSPECNRVPLTKFSYHKLWGNGEGFDGFRVGYSNDSVSLHFYLKYQGVCYSMYLDFLSEECPLFSETRILQDVFELTQDNMILQKGKKTTSEFKIGDQSFDDFLKGYTVLPSVHKFLKIYRAAEKDKTRVRWESLVQNPDEKLIVGENGTIKIEKIKEAMKGNRDLRINL